MKGENILLQGILDLSHETVTDYIIGSEEMRERIKKMKVGYKTDTDHQPIEAVIKGKKKWSRRNEVGRRIWRRICDKDEGKSFREELGRVNEVGNTKRIGQGWRIR